MKIAIFHNLPSGGAKRALFEWVGRLITRHQIDIYTFATANHSFCDIRPYVSQHTIFEFAPRGMFRSPFGRLNQFQRWRDLRDLERLNRRIARQINTGGYDLVFANPCIYTFIPSLVKYIEIPSVYYLHEPFGQTTERRFERPYSPNNSWRGSLDRIDPLISLYQNQLGSIQKQSIKKVKKLLANSHFTSDRIRAEFGRQAAICRYGVSLEDFNPIPNQTRGDFIVSVGEMSPRKGFDFLVESLGTIREDRRPALKLACNMVNEDELNYVKKLAESRRVNLEVLIGLNVDELRSLYNQAKMCAYSPVMEPFGLVPLEAMACGTPVVGVKEGGVQESVLHNQTGLLVEREPRQFGAAIEYLLADPKLAATLGRNGYECVMKDWSWEKSALSLDYQLTDCAGLNS